MRPPRGRVKARKLPVVWTGVAERDLAAIASYLQQDSPSAARKVLRTLEQQASSPETLPNRGRIVPALAALDVRSYR